MICNDAVCIIILFSCSILKAFHKPNFIKILNHKVRNPNSGRAVLRSKLEDGKCRVQFPVALIDLAIRNFPCFSPELAQIRAKIP